MAQARASGRRTVIGTRAEVHTVGRRAEIDALCAALAAARTGRGSLVGVAGEPGMGKTTLVEEFLAEAGAAGDGAVARGRCSERLAGSEAYLPVLEALDTLRQSAGDQVTRIMKEVAPVWYAQIVPLSGQSGESARMLDEIEAASQERLKREFVALVHEVSRSSWRGCWIVPRTRSRTDWMTWSACTRSCGSQTRPSFRAKP